MFTEEVAQAAWRTILRLPTNTLPPPKSRSRIDLHTAKLAPTPPGGEGHSPVQASRALRDVDEILRARQEGFQKSGYDTKTVYAHEDRPAAEAGFPDPKIAAAKLDRERRAADEAFDEMEEHGQKMHDALKTPLEKAKDEL